VVALSSLGVPGPNPSWSLPHISIRGPEHDASRMTWPREQEAPAMGRNRKSQFFHFSPPLPARLMFFTTPRPRRAYMGKEHGLQPHFYTKRMDALETRSPARLDFSTTFVIRAVRQHWFNPTTTTRRLLLKRRNGAPFAASIKPQNLREDFPAEDEPRVTTRGASRLSGFGKSSMAADIFEEARPALCFGLRAKKNIQASFETPRPAATTTTLLY